MRIVLFFITIGITQAFALESYAQATRLSLNVENQPIQKILEIIEEQTEFRFMYDATVVDVGQRRSINCQNQPVAKILDDVFAGSGITYKVEDRQIALSNSSTNFNFNRLSQQRTVSGKVTDSGDQPLPGVTVVVKGTTQGTVTNADGEYSISSLPENATLQFSFVGMRTQEISPEGRTVVNIIMEEQTIGIEEVVAVGYGTQKKINLTGAVATVSSDELSNRPVSSVGQAMQGLVSNLQISTTDGGRPGSSLSWQIRGSGSISLDGNGKSITSDSPLILIDGVPGGVNSLNPDDIESVSVLKDAAASAIYGSRAPYGVVLITTKKGKSEQMKVTLNSSFSWRNPLLKLEPMGSLQFMEYYNESSANLGIAPFFDQDYIDAVKYHINNPDSPNMLVDPSNPSNYYRNVATDIDWWSETYKSNALTQNYNISASGGSKSVTYYTSLGYLNEEGLYRYGNDYYRRYTGLLNVHADATKWLELNFKLQLSRRAVDNPNTDNTQFQAYRQWPITPIKDPNGHWTAAAHPLHIGAEGGRRNTNQDGFNNTIAFVIKPFSGLRINGDATYNSYYERYKENGKILYKYNALGEIIGTQSTANQSYIKKQNKMNNYYSANLYFDYAKQIKAHHLQVLAGYQQEYNHYFRLTGYRDNLIHEDILSLSAATGDNVGASDDETEWSTQGYFARLKYNFKEKYLFEFNGRYDGSSRFPKDLRWGFFPSASVGYNIAKEPWFESVTSVLNYMKFRASYGRLGNSNVNSLYYSPTMSKSQTDYIGPDGIFLIYVRTPGLGNYNLTWEKPTTINFGVDVGVLNNKLQGSFDWYRRNTIDMIGPSEPVAKVLGVSVPVSNNTEMKGTGWELSLNYKGVINDFNYGANVNVSHHREVVTKYYNPEGLFNSFYEGKEIGEIWGFETVGIINDEETLNNMADQSLFSKTWGLGDIQYKDQLTVDTDNDGIPDAGDGKITRGSQTLEDPGDYVRIGNETPDFYYNFTLSCEYKRFDLRLFFNGIGHADWWPGEGQGERSLDTDNVFFGSSNNYYNHATLVDHLDYWTPENQDAYYPRALVGNRNVSARNKQVQTRYLQNRAYIRLKNIQMGYTLPKNLTESYLIQSARIYISGENLFTYTKLKIFDPETPGLIYPLQKIFAAGIKVTF